MDLRNCASAQVPDLVLAGRRPAISNSAELPQEPAVDAYTALMERCWQQEPTLRPPFSEVSAELAVIRKLHHPQPKVSDHDRWADMYSRQAAWALSGAF